MHYLYILQSEKDNNFYTGTTSDLKRRLQEHSAGKNFSTAPRRPFKLIYYEAYLLKEDAEARVIRKQLSHFLESRSHKK